MGVPLQFETQEMCSGTVLTLKSKSPLSQVGVSCVFHGKSRSMKSNLGIVKAALGGKVGQIAQTWNRILSLSFGH